MENAKTRPQVLAETLIGVQDELAERLADLARKNVKGIVPDDSVDAASTGIMMVALGLLYGRMVIEKGHVDKETLEHVQTCDNCLQNLSYGLMMLIPVNGAVFDQTIEVLTSQGLRNALRPKKTPSVDIKIPGVKP